MESAGVDGSGGARGAAVAGGAPAGPCAGFEGDYLAGLAGVFSGLAAVAAVTGGEAGWELVNAAAHVLDEVIDAVELREYAGLAEGVVEWVPVDLAGLVGCVGAEGVGEALEWAAKTLAGAEAGPQPGSVALLGECAGWSVGAEALPPTTAAAAVLVTLVAAVNRSIASSGLPWAL